MSMTRRPLRRIASTNEAIDRMQDEQQFLQENEMSHRIHTAEESPFSTDSGFHNFRGFLNLGIILLVVSNFRVALENVLKYGILVDPFKWGAVFLMDPYHWPSVSLTLMIPFYIALIYGIEKLNARGALSATSSFLATVTVLAAMLIVPSLIIIVRHPNPVPFRKSVFSSVALTLHVIYFLKMWSYSHTNHWYRDARSRLRRRRRRSEPSIAGPNDDEVQEHHIRRYPSNVNVNDLVYYLFVPTLCYELNYPKNMRIRKRFLVKRLLELIFLPQLMAGLIQQWILPLLHNSIEPFTNSHWTQVVERLLKLSIPNHLIWLVFFYVFFHSAMNVVAELTLFADRAFYKDWWNCTSVSAFWSSWNLPVHRFCLRHVYKPLLRRNFNKFSASVVVFFISAFFHELIVSVPLHIYKIWAFAGMLAQVPLAFGVSYLRDYPQLSNVCVWLSLILGQPLVILMYFHDYYVTNVIAN